MDEIMVCGSCGALFDEPHRYQEDYGEWFSCCPRCGGEWEYAVQCDSCGEYTHPDKLEEGLCPGCRTDVIRRFREALSQFTEEELRFLNEVYEGVCFE